MNIWRMLKAMITTRGLKVLLLGKKVIMPDCISLGVVTAIRKELSHDRIWVVIDNQGQEKIIPVEQIAAVTNKVILFGDFLPSRLAPSRD